MDAAESRGRDAHVPGGCALIALIRDDNLVIYKIVVVEK